MKGQDFREAAEKYQKGIEESYHLDVIRDFTAGCEYAYPLGYSEAKKEVREWIPVSERLPEVDETVQVWRRKWILAKRRLVGDTTLWHYEGDTLYTYDAPTHWMPLPEPPKSLASFTDQEQKELPFD